MLNVAQCIDDPKLFQPWFDGPSWNAWRTVLKASAALPLTKAETKLFRQVADRAPPRKPVRELWCCVGRRGGKDSAISLKAAHHAAFFDAKAAKLRRGERAVVACLACDREQATIVLNYIRSFFTDIPLLKRMVANETQYGLELNNGVDIIVQTNDYRAVRGRSVACAIFDEVAMWRSDTSASPDSEVYNAIKPGTMTLSGMIIGISSPYKKSGLLYDKWKEHYGNDGDVLVIRAPSIVMNPTLDAKEIAREIERDPHKGKAEWLAEWRDDLSNFLDRQLIEQAVDRDVLVRPPIPGAKYHAFADPSGGANDAFTLAIAHRENETIILDCLVERKPPFNPNEVVAELSKTLRQYGLTSCQGDHYSAGFVTGTFAANSISYFHSYRDRSAIYADTIPLFTAGTVHLLDNNKLVNQLAALERRTTATRDKIDHPAHGHDDLCNAACGAMVLAADRRNHQPTVAPILITTPRTCFGDNPEAYSGGTPSFDFPQYRQ